LIYSRTVQIFTVAAVFGAPEGLTHATVGAVLVGVELIRAAIVEVDEAATVRAVWHGHLDEHEQVVAVDEADVVEVLPTAVVQHELDECGGQCGPDSVALDLIEPTVIRGAGPLAAGVEAGADRAPCDRTLARGSK
jgi:hypothetical protein